VATTVSNRSTVRATPRWRRALVTGASSGIGEAFARLLAAEGTDLIIVARRAERLERLAKELKGRHGVSVDVCVADLANHEQLRKVEEVLAGDDRPVDLLVNSAGGHMDKIGPFVAHDRDSVDAEAIVNAIAVLRLTHAATVHMTKQRRGNIINISAGVAFYPAPGSATYGASKAFVTSLSEAVNHELRGTGVHITTVCPGYTRTESPTRLGFNESNVPRLLWMGAEDLAARTLRRAARGTSVYTPGLINRLGAQIGHHLPRWIVLRWVGYFFRPRG